MDVEARVACEPALHRFGLVGGIVVEDQVQVELGRSLPIDQAKKADELRACDPKLRPPAVPGLPAEAGLQPLPSCDQTRMSGRAMGIINGDQTTSGLEQPIHCLEEAWLLDVFSLPRGVRPIPAEQSLLVHITTRRTLIASVGSVPFSLHERHW
jgi:hypothetical protein